ncbi:NTP transferase domain-containing protein [Demequina sp. TTPB684]|uniref:molybdenum cofactor guanylyltransferase n=1 Tax=unclassified Demequina TaxID=2620311 RepID=UPI001CF534C2|nr:NTP transferase domain-containing protein [Demequina sp. TMPB413]MCB2412115.1 NTP transferase domain-containing protein [Demequina sp. TTPB684]UPU88902.1 NTP transferase domain-containing protein [Demequina sp. TMPB413]
MSPEPVSFAAVIVAGGAGTRLSGVSKPELKIAGRTLLERTLDACEGASNVVIVGGEHLKREGALWACEDPPGSGPAAGLAAGLNVLDAEGDPSPLVLVLGTDTPRASAVAGVLLERMADDVAEVLLERMTDEGADSERAGVMDGAWLVDASGNPQPLVAVYRRDAIANRCASHAAPGASLRRVTEGLSMIAVPDVHDASRDVDTWEDVEYWEGKLS